jgi:hypothetical protein
LPQLRFGTQVPCKARQTSTSPFQSGSHATDRSKCCDAYAPAIWWASPCRPQLRRSEDAQTKQCRGPPNFWRSQ